MDRPFCLLSFVFFPPPIPLFWTYQHLLFSLFSFQAHIIIWRPHPPLSLGTVPHTLADDKGGRDGALHHIVGADPGPRNRFWSPNHALGANKNMQHSAIVRVPWRECGCQEQVSWETWFISTLDDLIDVTELSITYYKLLKYYMTCKIVIIINYMLQALWSPIQQTAIYHTNHILQAPQIS